jgi:hypothetical protein
MWTLLLRVIVYIGIVAVFHHLYEHFKTMFTTKKTKDLVSLHQDKYQEIIHRLEQHPPFPLTAGPNPEPTLDPESDHPLTEEDKAFLQTSLLQVLSETTP